MGKMSKEKPVYKLQKSTGKIMKFDNEAHWLAWFDTICEPFEIGDGILLDMNTKEVGVELKPKQHNVKPPHK